MKRMLLGSVVVPALALVTAAPAAASPHAADGPTAGSADVGVTLVQAADRGVNTAEPRVSCTYRVWWRDGVNIHLNKDRGSNILGHIPYNTLLTSRNCDNRTGGKYASCGTGNLWKAMSYGGAPAGWVATKCLTRW
jgi:hypothetical protein